MAEKRGRNLRGWNLLATFAILLGPAALILAEFFMRKTWCDMHPPLPGFGCDPTEFYAPSLLAASFVLLLPGLLHPALPEYHALAPRPPMLLSVRWYRQWRRWRRATALLRAENRWTRLCYWTDKSLVWVSVVLAAVAWLVWLAALLTGLAHSDIVLRLIRMPSVLTAQLFYGLAVFLAFLKLAVM